MRPLPRLHAITNGEVLALDDLGIRAAAIAAAGAAVALHARHVGADGEALFRLAERFSALASPPEACVFVNGRADIARVVGAAGVHLGQRHVSPGDARRLCPNAWIGCSVHSGEEIEAARAEGADYLVAGPIYATASHPHTTATGLGLLEQAARTGLPVIAIGGVDAANVAVLRAAGAWGVAAVTALWHANDSAAAALALLDPWMNDA